jgi:predicted nucleic acid-binding protein
VNRIVVDNSVAIRWFIENQATPYSDKVFAAVEGGAFMHVPALWFSEFCNVIVRAANNSSITTKAADGIIAMASTLPVTEVKTPNLPELYRLAKKYGLSGYDATYLAVAIELDAPLASEDDKLGKAAKSLGLYYC